MVGINFQWKSFKQLAQLTPLESDYIKYFPVSRWSDFLTSLGKVTKEGGGPISGSDLFHDIPDVRLPQIPFQDTALRTYFLKKISIIFLGVCTLKTISSLHNLPI